MVKKIWLLSLSLFCCVSAYAQGTIHTIAGIGCYDTVTGFDRDTGDGGQAINAIIHPTNICLDAAGNIYVSVIDATIAEIRKIDISTGIIDVYAGGRSRGYSGDSGLAINAQLGFPHGLFVDRNGDLYFADAWSTGLSSVAANAIRKVSASSGIITTVAGGGVQAGYGGDSGLAVNALLWAPLSVYVDTAYNIYIADSYNNRIRKVNAVTGIITTIAGNGVQGFSGDSGLAVNAKLYEPCGVYGNSSGDIFIGDMGNNRIRKIDHSTGIITSIAGTGSPGNTGDSGLGINAQINVSWIFSDRFGNIFFPTGNLIRRIDAFNNIITTVVGNGSQGFSGDSGPAINAKLNVPTFACTDANGFIYISDRNNCRIRKVDDLEEVKNISLNWPLRVSPNPSQGLFDLQFGQDNDRRLVKVYNMLGEVVYTAFVTAPQCEIDLSNYAHGVYILYVRTGENVQTQKLVISK